MYVFSCRIGLGGQLVRKMKKASTNLIGGGGNNNRNSLQGGGGVQGGSQGGTLSQRGSRRSTVPNSTSAGANLGSLDGPASGGLNHHGKFCLIQNFVLEKEQIFNFLGNLSCNSLQYKISF